MLLDRVLVLGLLRPGRVIKAAPPLHPPGPGSRFSEEERNAFRSAPQKPLPSSTCPRDATRCA